MKEERHETLRELLDVNNPERFLEPFEGGKFPFELLPDAIEDFLFELNSELILIPKENQQGFVSLKSRRIQWELQRIIDFNTEFYKDVYLPPIFKENYKETLKILESQKERVISFCSELLNHLAMPPMNQTLQLPKLKWKGKQKQLAELFLTLEEKGWFEPIQDGERTAICKNIFNLFDNAGEINSFIQIMKPDTDTQTKKKTYPQVRTTRYKPKFEGIKPH